MTNSPETSQLLLSFLPESLWSACPDVSYSTTGMNKPVRHPTRRHTLEWLYLVCLSDLILGGGRGDTEDLVIVGEGGHGRDERRASCVLRPQARLAAEALRHRTVPVFICDRVTSQYASRHARARLEQAPSSSHVSRLAALSISKVRRNTSVSTGVCSTGAGDRLSSPSNPKRRAATTGTVQGRCVRALL